MGVSDWSPSNVTSCHKDCLTKRAVDNCEVREKARKYSLIQQSTVISNTTDPHDRNGGTGLYDLEMKVLVKTVHGDRMQNHTNHSDYLLPLESWPSSVFTKMDEK